MRNRIKVTSKCVANCHTDEHETIIEFCDRATGRGGLISFKVTDNDEESLAIHAYRMDDDIRFYIPVGFLNCDTDAQNTKDTA